MKYIIITIAMLANVAAAIDDPCNNVVQANDQYTKDKAVKEEKHYKSIASTLENISILSSKDVKSRNYMREMRDADGFLDFLLKMIGMTYTRHATLELFRIMQRLLLITC